MTQKKEKRHMIESIWRRMLAAMATIMEKKEAVHFFA